jgi:hypothetical protein
VGSLGDQPGDPPDNRAFFELLSKSAGAARHFHVGAVFAQAVTLTPPCKEPPCNTC